MSNGVRPKAGRVVGEFVLIVVGVLAALAVDELREASGDRAQERSYLEALVQDFERSAEDIRSVQAVYAASLAYGSEVLPVLRGDLPMPADTVAFLVGLFEITRSPEPAISRATYEDMLSTGSMDLVRTDSVRHMIVDYFESIERILRPTDYNVDRAPYRTALRSLLPFELQMTIRTCPTDGDLAQCRAAIESHDLHGPVVSVLSEPDLARHLTFSLQSAAIRAFPGAIQFSEYVASRLREELAGS